MNTFNLTKEEAQKVKDTLINFVVRVCNPDEKKTKEEVRVMGCIAQILSEWVNDRY